MQDAKQVEELKRPPTLEEMDDFLRRAREGDASTLPSLKKLVEDPAIVDALGGDLAAEVQESFVSAAAGKNLAFKTSLNRKLANLRSELAGSNVTPLEKLLVERIVACCLQLHLADIQFAQAKNLTIRQGEYLQNRMDRAQRRYLSAIKTLALVRKMAIPVLQVNIARKQTNVAAACVMNDGTG
jgi:hypothetical protein